MEWMLASIVANGLMVLAFERTMNVFFERKRTSFFIFTVSLALMWVTLMLQSWWAGNPFLLAAFYFFALAVLSLNYESVPMKRVAAVAGSHYVSMFTTGMVNNLAGLLPADWFMANVGWVVVGVCLAAYLVTILIFPLFKHIKESAINLNKLWIPFVIFPFTNTFIELFHHLNPPVVRMVLLVTNTLIIILVFLALYNIISRMFGDTVKSALHAREKEYYFTQCRLMQESVEKMKAYRHDMKLHLAALREFSSGNEAAINYLDALQSDMEANDIYSDTGNIAFDSIINYKLKNAAQNGIKTDVNVHIPPSLPIEVADAVTILGNLLDNALEGTAKTDDKRLALTVTTGKGNLYIKLENTFDGGVAYANDVITTRKDNAGHGYGIKNIRTSAEKYNGHVDIYHDDSIFTVGVLLYLTD
ncbi:MAG: ATP-binding protein [Defluviitaleaceae bacterium]|nr:ATP-binding protein [Defluviitaleaceae bacterium]